MKNYFTDSQVKEIALQICEVTNKQTHDGSTIYEFTENRLKALMNLAVEAAIGEPVRTITLKSNGWYEKHNEYDNKDIEHCIKEKIYVRNLYSVKELEN